MNWQDVKNKFTSGNVEGALKGCIDRSNFDFQEIDSAQ